jgi:hypothetical protein
LGWRIRNAIHRRVLIWSKGFPYKKKWLLIEILQNSYENPSIQKALIVNSCYMDDNVLLGHAYSYSLTSPASAIPPHMASRSRVPVHASLKNLTRYFSKFLHFYSNVNIV